MKIFVAAFMFLLFSSIAFAQSINDIGRTLFVELLGMRNYPGSPFTGNIINDLIMFLIIPTIFIIFVVFILLGRLAVAQRGIRILLGIGIYLFIIAGGYYNTFALAAGPYFIFLIFILGLLYFIPSHFRVRGGGMPGGAGAAVAGTGPDQIVQDLSRIKALTAAVKSYRTGGDTRFLGQQVAELGELTEKVKIEMNKYGGINRFMKLNPLQATVEGHLHLNPRQIISDAEQALHNAGRYVKT